jgi:asparagine synthase (glutamine-hydrolysing)
MPGIVGFITKGPRNSAEPRLQQMVKAIQHEAFYETGTWIDEKLGIYVGWTARRGSFSDGMPLCNEKGDVTLIFSGEEYSRPETVARLKARGHSFDDRRASHLVHLYEDDCDFLRQLNGLFHGFVVDRTRDMALLFNDRYGMHRLYFHESKDGLYFAAEAKAILAVLPELREPNQQSLGEFVSCSCVLEDRTIFQQIHALPAGSAWVVRGGQVVKKQNYFQPKEWEQQEPLAAEPFYLQLRENLSRNLPLYFRGEEQVGIALTGGLDTRVIMAWQEASAGTLPCYTFGGMFRDCRDVKVARQVSRQCRQSHRVIEVGDEFLRQFPRYAERTTYLTEGAVDVYRAPDLYVSEHARQIAPAKVVGTYGSEIIRNAVMFKPMAPADGVFHPDFLPNVRQARKTYMRIRSEHPVTFAAFRQSPWYHHGVLGLEQTQLTVHSPFLDNEFVRTVYRAPHGAASNGDVRLRLIKDGSSTLSRIPSDRGVGGSAISQAWLEFTFKAEYAYDYGMPQWLVHIDRSLAALRLQSLFLGRHKFSHFRVWYRDWLDNYLKQILLDPVALSRPYIDRKVLTSMVENHTCGQANYTTSIHKLLTLELLHRQFFDSK